MGSSLYARKQMVISAVETCLHQALSLCDRWAVVEDDADDDFW